MNAPAKKNELAAPQSAFQMIAIDDICASNTHIQQLRSSRFDPVAMDELVQSITAHGVLQPIVVRRNPNAHATGPNPPLWEIVAGERRWIAARTAKLPAIPAVCRDLTDLQVLEIQLVENLQREGLHPLEEAEGYYDLMLLKHISADAVADEIGKSRSYVYGRLKLRSLQAAARDAFAAGELDASKALELARITNPAKQASLLAWATGTDWRGDRPSVRALRDHIERRGLTKPLAAAPFDTAAVLMRFVKGRKGVEDCSDLPPCADCPQRAGEGSEDDPYVCTDIACFDDKIKDTHRLRRVEAAATGRTILSGSDASEVLAGKSIAFGKVLNLDEACDFIDYPEAEPQEPETDYEDSPEWHAYEKAQNAWQLKSDAWTQPTYRQLLADAPGIEPVLVEEAKTKALIEVVPVEEAVKILQAKGIEVPSWIRNRAEEGQPTGMTPEDQAAARAKREKEQLKLEAEMAHRRAVLAAIHAKWKGPYKREDWLDVVAALWEGGDQSSTLNALYGDAEKDPPLTTMKETDLQRFILELLVCDQCDNNWNHPIGLFALAKRCKIDPAKVKKDMIAAAKAKDKPAAVKAPAKKKAVKK